jgi:trimethylamine:corrinoid methyltransferase-like protein
MGVFMEPYRKFLHLSSGASVAVKSWANVFGQAEVKVVWEVAEGCHRRVRLPISCQVIVAGSVAHPAATPEPDTMTFASLLWGASE